MYRFKFAAVRTVFVNYLAVLLLLVATLVAYFAGLVNGLNYVYQSLVGQVFGFCYLVFCLSFDREIHKICEKCGFILQSSRGKKFDIFFACLAMYVFVSLYFFACGMNWYMPQNWVVNSIQGEPKCLRRFPSNAGFRIGLDQTYNLTSSLFFVVGMVFGQSYVMNYVKPLLWVHTNWTKKILRATLGALLAMAIYIGFYEIGKENNDLSEKYLYLFALPGFLVSFFSYGIFPIICQWVGLVAKGEPIQVAEKTSEVLDPNLRLSETSEQRKTF
jgi:hypothetical protein